MLAGGWLLRGGYTYQPFTAEMPFERRELEAGELESSIRESAEATWERYQEQMFSGCWNTLQSAVKRSSERSYVRSDGRLEPVSNAMPGAPAPARQFTEEWRSKWIEHFSNGLEWCSTGIHRMRSDGAIEAEMQLTLGFVSWFPPDKPTFGSYLEDYAIGELAGRIVKAPSETARRELIERYFEQASAEYLQRTWLLRLRSFTLPLYKWVVVREP